MSPGALPPDSSEAMAAVLATFGWLARRAPSGWLNAVLGLGACAGLAFGSASHGSVWMRAIGAALVLGVAYAAWSRGLLGSVEGRTFACVTCWLGGFVIWVVLGSYAVALVWIVVRRIARRSTGSGAESVSAMVVAATQLFVVTGTVEAPAVGDGRAVPLGAMIALACAALLVWTVH